MNSFKTIVDSSDCPDYTTNDDSNYFCSLTLLPCVKKTCPRLIEKQRELYLIFQAARAMSVITSFQGFDRLKDEYHQLMKNIGEFSPSSQHMEPKYQIEWDEKGNIIIKTFSEDKKCLKCKRVVPKTAFNQSMLVCCDCENCMCGEEIAYWKEADEK